MTLCLLCSQWHSKVDAYYHRCLDLGHYIRFQKCFFFQCVVSSAAAESHLICSRSIQRPLNK